MTAGDAEPPGDPVQRLLNGIAAHAAMWSAGYGRARGGWAYPSFPALLLACGQVFAPAPRPPRIRPGVPGMCFAEASRLADEDEGLIYVEGMVLTAADPFGFDHAWCCRAGGDGVAIDLVLPDGMALAYVGVPVAHWFRRAEQARRGTRAVFTVDRAGWEDNAEVLRAGVPGGVVPLLGGRLPPGATPGAAGRRAV